MKRTWILGLTIVLTGCAVPNWQHPTNSEYDFNRDKALCSMASQQANPSSASPYDPTLTAAQQAQLGYYNAGANIGRGFAVQNYFENCMTARGYYKVK
ncbi:MAG: hypothetical protein RLZ63_1541 [Pseudomonadota bacterium]|jgi:ribosomal protein L13E